MERLCWFKGITILFRQNQLIICFTGTTRLTATPLTTHTQVVISQKPIQDANSLVKSDSMKRERDKTTERRNTNKTIRKGERYEVKRQKRRATMKEWG